MNTKYLTRFLLFGVIPFSLLLFWFIFSLFFTSKYSFSVIAPAYDKSSFTSFKTDELLAKQKVAAEFQAKENNLGIIAVRFYNFNRISDDYVIFNLIDKESGDLLYENKYKVDQFQNNDYFTFGFPIVENSKNKEYRFEIISLTGKKGNAIGLSKTSPAFVTEYQFSKQQLLANKKMIPIFLAKKIFYSFSDINFVISSLVYLLPFILYISWLYLARPYIKIKFKPHTVITIKNWTIPIDDSGRKKYLLFYIFTMIILLMVFFMNLTNNYIYLILISLWVFLIVIYRFESKISYLLALSLLVLCPFLFIINLELVAENAAIWAYFFLVIGTAQLIVEYRKNFKNMITYDVFLKENLTWKTKQKLN
jgi:hypothetical protein